MHLETMCTWENFALRKIFLRMLTSTHPYTVSQKNNPFRFIA